MGTIASRNQASTFAISATPIVGREREITALGDLLRQPAVRLVTLTGPGGVGKTRLALRVAEAIAEDVPDGLWFVPLASIRDPALVLSAIARALEVRETGHRSLLEGIAHFLHGKQALLVLDNFEHVVESAPLVAELLAVHPIDLPRHQPGLLRVSGEHAFPVPPSRCRRPLMRPLSSGLHIPLRCASSSSARSGATRVRNH